MIRTHEDYERHISRIDECGKHFRTMYQSYAGYIVAIPFQESCGSRFCPRCGKRRKRLVIEKMKYFKDVPRCVKLELTFPDDSPSPAEHPEFYSHAWDIFLKRIRRRHPKVKYFRILEFTQKGIPHFHILLNCFISHRWITETFPECGGGSVNWIHVVDPGHAFGYITKYISKGFGSHSPHDELYYRSSLRQYSYSRGLFVFVPRSDTYHVNSIDIFADLFSLYHDLVTRYCDRIVLVDFGDRSPPIFIIDLPDHERLFPSDYFIARGFTRENLFKARFDQDTPQARSRYAVYQ